MKKKRRTTSVQSNRRGVTLVEFAIVLPVFLLFMIAAIEFAHLNTLRNTANNAAYEAARAVVVPGGKSSEATVEAGRILAAVGTTKFTVDVTPGTITDDTQQVTVNVRIPYEKNALMVPWFTGGLTISSESTLKTERYGGISVP